jgi:glycerol-3-phosphate dehydrogenase
MRERCWRAFSASYQAFFNMQIVNRIGVIGAGAWGTALAKHMAEKGLHVRLWAYERDVVDSINQIPRIESSCLA